jgi:hypothetical protein
MLEIRMPMPGHGSSKKPLGRHPRRCILLAKKIKGSMLLIDQHILEGYGTRILHSRMQDIME